MMTCEPSSSVIVAPARCAVDRTTSVPAALSAVATIDQAGRVFHAGTTLERSRLSVERPRMSPRVSPSSGRKPAT
jgi:hypothetical protein